MRRGLQNASERKNRVSVTRSCDLQKRGKDGVASHGKADSSK